MGILDTLPKQTYGLANNGAVPKTKGVLSGYSMGIGQVIDPRQPTKPSPISGQPEQPNYIQGQILQKGTSAGMLPKDTTMKGVSTPPVVNVGGKSQVMKGSPSVLAQQQALNKLGAGLVEDGIAGEKTKAAIAQYGSGASTIKDDFTTGTKKGIVPETPKPTTYTPENLGVGGVSQGGLIGNAVKQSQEPSQTYTDSQNKVAEVAKRLSDFDTQTQEMFKNTSADGISLDSSRGQNANIAQARAAERASIANELATMQGQVSAANTQQGLQQSALSTAIGANAPIQQPYSNMLINPATGQLYSQTGGTLQDVVSGVVQKLTNGEMTYNDALQALSGYGQGGVNALQQALPKGFNIAQSNTMAGQQGSIGINYQLADAALQNVEKLITELNPAQRTNVPAINKVTNWISTQFGVGSEQTRAVTGAVQSLRNAYASLLASAKGGIPTDYSVQAMAEIPNEPTPNDIVAIRKNFETLGKARANILGNPGQSTTSGSTTGGGFAETW